MHLTLMPGARFLSLGRVLACFTLAWILAAPGPVWAYQLLEGGTLPDFDRRVEAAPKVAVLPAERAAAVNELRRAVRTVQVEHDELLMAPRYIGSPHGFLTGPQGAGGAVRPEALAAFPAQDPHRSIKAFLAEHATLFGHGDEVLLSARVVRDDVAAHNGLRTIIWEQQLDGLPVFGATLAGHLTRRAELVNLSSQMLPAVQKAAAAGTPEREKFLNAPPISDAQAVSLAANNLGEVIAASTLVPQWNKPEGPTRRQRFRAPALVGEAEAQLVWLPMNRDQLRLCWLVEVARRLGNETYRLLVDARTGEVHLRHARTFYLRDISLRVFTSDSPSPRTPGYSTPTTNQPPLAPRFLVTYPALSTNASPLGWVNDDLNETLGNNIDAHLDRNHDNFPDLPRPHGSPERVFDFPLDLTQPPTAYGDASVVQLFYWCNWMHDQLYELGFTEAAGNFQKDNFGRGGFDNDAIQADAQDGAGFNNANFTPSRDGGAGRIQMYVFNGPTPDRDGDLDAEVICHEYTHGLTDRLVGGVWGIYELQTYGLAEGWSDFYALALLSELSDPLQGVYPIGGYVTYQLGGLTQNYYYGIRRYPYSTNLLINPLTFSDIDPERASTHPGISINPIFINEPSYAAEVHRQGEVWCSMLWEARAALIARHGFDVGNRLILQLVTDGLKLSPPNPNFVQARDGILQADLVNTGGANLNDLWAAFAKRGMGVAAIAPQSFTTTGVTESYNQPDVLNVLPATPILFSGGTGGPFAPPCRVLLLTNATTESHDWAIGGSRDWFQAAPAAGTLAAGTGVTVIVCVNSNALVLPPGVQSAHLVLTNFTTGRVQLRAVELRATEYAAMPFVEDFEAAELGAQWLLTGQGFWGTVITTNYQPRSGAQHLLLAPSSDGLPARNEVTLGLDLAGYTNVVLNFWVKRLGDEPDGPPPRPFYDGANFDGVAISTDGLAWYEAAGFRLLSDSYVEMRLDLDAVMAANHLGYNSRFLIRFNEYDNHRAPEDGIVIDEIVVTGKAPQRFFVTLPPAVREGQGTVTGQGWVALPEAPARAVTVFLRSSQISELRLPSAVVIPAGTNSISFPLYVGDDSLLDGPQRVTVTASSTVAGFFSGSAALTIEDNESATLSVITPDTAVEGQGSLERDSFVISSAPPDVDLRVNLFSTDTNEVTVSAFVVLERGEIFTTLPAQVVNDGRIDGPRMATIVASLTNWGSGSSSITILDNETTNVWLAMPTLLSKGSTVPLGLAQARISGTLTTNLPVSLEASDTNLILIPGGVTIAAGQTSASILVTVPQTPNVTGGLVTLIARAPGFDPTPLTIRILDNEMPPTPFGPSPIHLATNQPLEVTLSWKLGLAELLDNGGFETGSFDGWQTTDQGEGGWLINNGSIDPPGPEGATPPLSGQFSALSQQSGPGIHVLAQDVTIPYFANSATFSWSHRVRNHADRYDSNQAFRVEIRGLDDRLIGLVFSTAPGDARLQDWSDHSLSLMPFRGQRVRLAFVEEDSTGYLNVSLDAVQVYLGPSGTTSSEVFFSTHGPPGPSDLVAITTANLWTLPALPLETRCWWQIVARRDELRAPGPVWEFRTRGIGPLHHFGWSPIAATQRVSEPFPVTLTAQDDLGNTVTDYASTVQFSATTLRRAEPVQVLTFTAYSDLAGDYRRTLAALSLGFTNYTETTTAVTDPVGLSSLLINKDVFVVVAQDSAPVGQMTELGQTWAPVLSNFVSYGGQMVVCSYLRDEHQILNQAGLVSLRKLGQLAAAEVDRVTNHLLLEGVSTPFIGQGIARYLPTNAEVVLQTVTTTNAVVVSKRFGQGRVTMIGTDFSTNRTGFDRILANAVKQRQGPTTQPLTIQPPSSGYFYRGVWSGALVPWDVADSVVVRASSAEGFSGDSGVFAVTADRDLGITASDSPELLTVGQTIQFAVTLRNNGSTSFSGAGFKTPLPAGMEFVSATNPAGTCTASSNQIACGVGTLRGGESVRVGLTVRALSGGRFYNTFLAQANEPDAYWGNNTAQTVSYVEFPMLSIGEALVYEGDSGIRQAVFTVNLSVPSSQRVWCEYASTNIAATAGEDYQAVAGLLVFEPGVTNRTVVANVFGDTRYESYESFLVALFHATNAAIIDSLGYGLISDDDPLPSITINDATVVEGPKGVLTNALFALSLSGHPGVAAAVEYTTLDLTAQAGSDYAPVSGTAVFPLGVTNITVSVPVVGDHRAESNKTFNLRLRQPANATLLRDLALGTIVDDDLGRLDHFEWSLIPSPQWINTPFPVTVTARDALGNPVVNFNGPVRVTGLTERRQVSVGDGTNSWEWPLGTYYHDERAQLIYPVEEMGAAARLTALALDVTALPGQTLSNFTIRLKHTPQTSFTSANWDDEDWTIVYRGDDQLFSTGWTTFNFTAPFEYNGLESLLVDMSFNNASYSSNGFCRVTATPAARALHFRTDSAFGDPLAWSDQSPPPMMAKQVPNIRWSVETPLAMAPTHSGPFVTGVWAGTVTMQQPADLAFLRAEDGFGHTGLSDGFVANALDDISLLLFDAPDPVRIGEPLSYTLIVSNTGPAIATGVVLTNRLPPRAQFVSATASQGACSVSNGLVTCELGTLLARQSVNAGIQVRALTSEVQTNRAGITRAEADSSLANNHALTYTTVSLPMMTISDLTLTEGNAGVIAANFAVRLNGPSLEEITINYTTVDGLARAGFDYGATNGVLVFAPGVTNLPVVVPVFGDGIRESNETFTVVLSKPVHTTLVDATGVCTLLDDEPLPAISIADASIAEGDEGTVTMNFNLTLSLPTEQLMFVRIRTSNITATALSDYLPRNINLPMVPSLSNRVAVVPVYSDRTLEPDETFSVHLSAPVNASLGRSNALGTILNDDGIPGKLDHFTWSPIGSPQYEAQPITVTVTARDLFEGIATNFQGLVMLEGRTGQLDAVLDRGAGSWPLPFGTSSRQARSQVIYLSNELAGARSIYGLALDVATPPGQALLRWTIRMKHTALSSYTTAAAWETNGWSVVYQGDVLVTNTGWTTFSFPQPFAYDGTNHLMVDFSFDNPLFTTDGECRITNSPTARAMHFQADGEYGDPLHWSGTDSPQPIVTSALFNTRFVSGHSAPITPTVSGNFTRGAWLGTVTVQASATNLFLVSRDDQRRVAVSSRFNVDSAADSNQNGLADAWEYRYFNSLNSPAGAPLADPDGDGLTNLEEYRAGTDPLDAASVVRIVALRVEAGETRLEFASVAGKGYRIETAPDLTGPWTTLHDRVQGTGEVVTVRDPGAAGAARKFYQIRLIP